MNWENVTLENYVKYYESLKWDKPSDALEELEQSIQRVAYLLNSNPEEVEELTHAEIIAQLESANTDLPTVLYESFEFKGRRYVVDTDPTKYKAGRYISVMNACKDDTLKNLHRVLFVVCREVDAKGNDVDIPDNEIHQRIKDFKELPLKYANPIAVFFWSLSKNLTDVILEYLPVQAAKAKEMIEAEIAYLKDTDG